MSPSRVSGIVKDSSSVSRKSKIGAITIDRQFRIHTEHDAILKQPQESAGAAGWRPSSAMRPPSSTSRVRILFHPICYLVPSPLHDWPYAVPKTGAGMAFKEVIALSQQLRFLGEAIAEEAPVRMHNQLLVSARCGDQPVQRRRRGPPHGWRPAAPIARLFPHTVQPGVIDADQLPLRSRTLSPRSFNTLTPLAPASGPGRASR